jgi:hypothetical protein
VYVPNDQHQWQYQWQSRIIVCESWTGD